MDIGNQIRLITVEPANVEPSPVEPPAEERTPEPEPRAVAAKGASRYSAGKPAVSTDDSNRPGRQSATTL